ncbi:MAG TPA: carbohydrate porin [Syntrophorhabdales bacterium]|nr:carbohydrate porin [Syntrophorhabdales bacterium]
MLACYNSPQERFGCCGIGYYYIDITSPTFTGPFATREALRDEQGIEAYYNIAVTPWMKVRPDIQVIKGAQKNVVSINTAGTSIVNTKAIDTATVLGLRLQLIF